MEPLEVLIPISFFFFVAFIVKVSLDHKRWKIQQMQGGPSPDKSLGTSELKALIREAVAEANAPLLGRLESLEARLDTLSEPRLMPAARAEMLEAHREEAMPAVLP